MYEATSFNFASGLNWACPQELCATFLSEDDEDECEDCVGIFFFTDFICLLWYIHRMPRPNRNLLRFL